MQSFDVLFNKRIIDFYYDNKKYKNISTIFTFINSILSIVDETFNLNDLNYEYVFKDTLITVQTADIKIAGSIN